MKKKFSFVALAIATLAFAAVVDIAISKPPAARSKTVAAAGQATQGFAYLSGGKIRKKFIEDDEDTCFFRWYCRGFDTGSTFDKVSFYYDSTDDRTAGTFMKQSVDPESDGGSKSYPVPAEWTDLQFPQLASDKWCYAVYEDSNGDNELSNPMWMDSAGWSEVELSNLDAEYDDASDDLTVDIDVEWSNCPSGDEYEYRIQIWDWNALAWVTLSVTGDCDNSGDGSRTESFTVSSAMTENLVSQFGLVWFRVELYHDDFEVKSQWGRDDIWLIDDDDLDGVAEIIQ